MSLVSLYIASSSSPGRPDPSLGPERPPELTDDIPLRIIQSKWIKAREDKDRPSPLPTASNITFPFASPFTPMTPAEAGTSATSTRKLPDLDTENDPLLSVTAKSSTGGLRWCKKCDGWKPDRCHHCRFCKQCTLKMDHHCVWVGNCVGYRNYKPFILFLTYGTLLAVYCAAEAGLEVYRFFTNPDTYNCPPERACSFDFAPVVYIVLTIMGVFLGLSVGSLCAYHWYLTLNNITTVENITHAFPAALLADKPSWRPEHLLTHQERVRLRNEARDINVFDLGWQRNVRESLVGHHASWWSIALPWRRPKSAFCDTGHSFPINERALQRLRDLTTELRLARAADEEDEEDEDGEDDGVDEDEELQDARSDVERPDRPHVAWFDNRS